MLRIVGTVKLDTADRVKAMLASLDSMKPMAHLIESWHLNIAGKMCYGAQEEIAYRWENVHITTDSERAPYQLIQNQIEGTNPNSLLLFWQEDHWFVCPHVAMWEYVLDAFEKSKATYLQASHLRTAWKRKPRTQKSNVLYQELLVDAESQRQIWQRYPKASVLGIPAVFKRSLLEHIIDSRQAALWQDLSPAGFEIPRSAGIEFLKHTDYTEMVPAFHVFREAHIKNWRLRCMDAQDALAWIKLRDAGSQFGGSHDNFNE